MRGFRTPRFASTDGCPPRAVTVSATRNRGRGNVYVLRQRTPENGYSFTIRIEDNMPGSDTYDCTVIW